MATKRPSFEKMERDRNKRAKQAAKREKRQAKGEDGEDEAGVEAAAPQVDESAVLGQLEALHQRYDAEEIDFDTFEERRTELLGQLTQD